MQRASEERQISWNVESSRLLTKTNFRDPHHIYFVNLKKLDDLFKMKKITIKKNSNELVISVHCIKYGNIYADEDT